MKQQHVWPEEIPQDYKALFSGTWMAYISREVRRRNKVIHDFEDVLASVCEKLFAAKVLDKFVAKAATRQPAVLTAKQSCAYLGVSWGSWFALQNAFHHRNSPEAIAAHTKLLRERNAEFLLLSPEEVTKRNEEIVALNKARPKKSPKIPILKFRKDWQRRVPSWMPSTVVAGKDGEWIYAPKTGKHGSPAGVLNEKSLFLFSDIQKLDILIDQNEKVDQDYKNKVRQYRLALKTAAKLEKEWEDKPVAPERPAYSNVFPSRAGEDRPHNLPVTSLGFKTYLLQAIHRHFLNLCRTNRRRFNREHPMTEDTALVADSSGTFHKAGAFEGIHGWEDTLVGETLDSDDLYDCIAFKRNAEKACNEAGIDLSRINEFVMGSANDGAGPTPEAMRALRVLEAVGDGTTLSEAIRKAQVKTRTRSRTG